MSITLSSMAEAIQDEAIRIRRTQDALIKAGMRSVPDQKQIAKADLFEAAARFLDRLAPVMPQIRRLLGERDGAGRQERP